MKKWLFILCVTFIGWQTFSKTNLPGSKIIFNANSQPVVYSGAFDQANTSGIGVTSNQISFTDSSYRIFCGNSSNDNLQIVFQTKSTLKAGQVNFINGTAIIGYKKGDSTYFSDGSDFTVKVSSYNNKILNGTFSGILKTQYGTAIHINNGQFINVPSTN